MVKKNPLSTFGINQLIHIRQREKIALEIAAKVASVNGLIRASHERLRCDFLLLTDVNK
jgi:hypothetical protein